MISGRGRGRGRGRDLSSMNGDMVRQAFQNQLKKEEDIGSSIAANKENGSVVSGKKVKMSLSLSHNTQVVVAKEVEIANKVEPLQEMMRMMVVEKRFPNEFYMIRESDKFEFSKNNRAAAEFQDGMNKAEMPPDTYLVTAELQKCYAYQEPRSRSWSRVRLLQVVETHWTEIALVYHIDKGFQALVPLRALRQLPEKWLYPVVPVFRCHLYDVIPIDGGGDYHWSDEATSFFDATVQEKLSYLVCPVKSSASVVHRSSVDKKYDIGVLIYIPSVQKGTLRCVNYEMMAKGYGLAVGPGASHIDMLYLPKRLPEYKRQINMESETKSFFENKNISFHQLTGNYLSQIKLRHVVDPSCLFVQMTAKLGELKAMEEDLGKAVNDLKAISPSDFQVGLSITCGLKGYAGAETTWNRAVVYEYAVCARTVRVILVDYGEIITISVNRVYPLPDQFQKIHSFAIRLHLNEIYPVDVDDQTTTTGCKPLMVWSSRINSALDSLTSALEMENPVYHAFQPSFSDVIKLKNIHQKLEFDMKQRKWKAYETGAEEQGTTEEAHGKVQKNSLLTSHLYSFGVVIMFQVEGNQGLFTKQEYLTDLLLECARDDVRLIKPRFNKKKYFGKLVKLHEIQGL